MSNTNVTEGNGSADNNKASPFFGSFSLTAPVFIVPSTSNITLGNNQEKVGPVFSNGESSNPGPSIPQPGVNLQAQAINLQAIHSSLQAQQIQKPFPVPVYQGKILNPVPVKPVKSVNKRPKGKSTSSSKQRYTMVSTPQLPPQLTSVNFPNLAPQVVADGFTKSRKRSRDNVEMKDTSCQTSGWKFMSEIGTIEALKEKSKNRDKQASKSTIIATLRDICRRFKQKVEVMNYDSAASHSSLMNSIVEDFNRWFRQQHVESNNSCLLCEQKFLSDKAVQQHLVSSCIVLRTIFVETVVGVTQPINPDQEDVTTDESKDKTVNPSIIQDLFSKSYLHANDAQALKGRCMFCGEQVKTKEVSETDMYLDKRHLFDSCIVFKSFLLFHNQSYIQATSQKVGTSWTFLYYYSLLNYFALNFQYDINDLRFVQEDKANYILQILGTITESIIHRATECPLCYSNITNSAVLQHHIAFSLCPFLLKFYQDIRVHIDQVWKVPGQIESLRKISSCFQYFMSFQSTAKPIMIKQSILNDKLAYKLLENAMYFKSLDHNFSLQFYKCPKESVIAFKIEELQQQWAEEVLQGKDIDVATECPFCFNTFNTEKNLLKHIVYISCKSIRPVCNQIYNLLEYCEWDVLNPVAIVTQHSCYIIKQAILRGEFEINLQKEQLTEYINIVTAKFLNFNLTDKMRNMLFDSTEESVIEPDLTPDEATIFQDFFSWAKRVIKKKNGAMCPLCGQDRSFFNLLVNHLALGACPYLKQFLHLMDEIYKYSHLFRPCQAPTRIVISKNRSITFDFVHHIRKVLFLFKGSTKSAKFFDHDEFEAFLINSPQNYVKHTNLMSIVIGKEVTTCSFCFMDLKSQDHLLLHLLFFRCPTIMFVIDLVKNEWNKCSKGSMAKTEKMLDIIKIYSSMFELDPCTVISSGNMKRYFNEDNNRAMLKNFKFLQSWAQEMFTYDAQSTLNICNACNVAAEHIERHLWLEEPVENFCPEIKSYLDFHRKMVCKKDNRGEIKASFTVTDLFELKRFIQSQYSHLHVRSEADSGSKQSIISPSLRNQIMDSINMTLKIYPRYDGTMESFRLMFGTSPAFLAKQIAIADKIAVSKMCFLCDIMFQSVEDVRYHIATFECRVLQNMLLYVKSQDQIDKEVVKNELMNAYKRTVAYCRELYPNLFEGNLLLVMETVDPQCHSKLYNFIVSKIPRNNPYKCSFCTETFSSMGEIYSHYKRIQCLGLKECFGFIPNKSPKEIRHPFLQVVYKIFLNCYKTFGMRNHSKLKSLLVGVNNLADFYEFWCSNYCDSLVPECPFCDQDLLSVSMIKSHPMTCPKLRETNLEVFRSDRLQDSSFMKQQGLGSCKLTGELPREVTKESEGVPFMQRYRCSQYLGWIPLCLDCATSGAANETNLVIDEETCRFLWFRRLVKKDNRLVVFDFESSQSVANITSWVPSRNSIAELKVEAAKYILRHLLPHFNQLMTFELWELENVPNIRLKHQVKNVRELCDTCTTTLFNIHLFCPRCGYVICMDCYRDRLAGFVSTGLADCSDGSVHNLTTLHTCVTIPPRAVKQLCSAVEAVKDLHCISVTDLPFTRCPSDEIPYELICNGQVLALREGDHPDFTRIFSKFLQKGNAVVVYGVQDSISKSLWSPESFSKHFGTERERVLNTSTLEVHRISLKDFFDGFENVNERPRNENGDPMILKLKDWPTTWDFKEKLPQWYEDFMKVIPLKNYTQRCGLYNIARYLPNIYCTPDLGPKMYIAYSNANNPNEGSTVLHIDISDAVNIIMYVGQSQDVVINYDDEMTTNSDSTFLKRKVYSLKDICEDTDDKQLERIRREKCKIGALWHIYHPNDIDKIRHFIHKVLNENGQTLPSGHDPIHDQAMYLDKNMRKRLFQEYGVRGWAIVQCEGEAVFIPAGAPHQVRNLQSCIKIAEDYVSPERVGFCLKHTQEIRHLSKQHSNQEDKLQIKNLIYHGVKECVSVLQNHLPTKELCTCKPVETCTTSTQFTTPQDSRDLTIERLQIELEALRKNAAFEKKSYKDLLASQEADYKKARRCYEVEKQTNKELKGKLMKCVKRQDEQASQSFVKVVPGTYQPSETRSHDIQKPEARVQEIRKPEARHPQHRNADSRHSDHSKSSESRSLDIRSGDIHMRHRAASASSSDLKRNQYSNFEPADYSRASSSHATTSQPSSSNSRDPRLKHKMVEAEEIPAHSSGVPIWDPRNYNHSNPRLPPVVPKSAFQGVQHAVQDLRKKQPPPQKIRKTPETPEPMDTNQDSCSPSPASLYGDGIKNNLEMLSAVSAVQPRSYPTNRVYDQGASNSETDSNEEALNPQYAGNFTPTPPACKSAVIPGPFSSPSVSPGFNPKSLNLQISSPKQPAIFSKQSLKKGTYQKVKEELVGKPRHGQSSSKSNTLSEIFPLQPVYSNTYSSVKQAITTKKPIKTELRTPPGERINPPTFAPHLASYLPDMLTRSTCDRTTWNTDPRKTVASPVTPTMSPAATIQTVATSPATPSPPPPPLNQQQTVYSTPPIVKPTEVTAPPKIETAQQSSCALQNPPPAVPLTKPRGVSLTRAPIIEAVRRTAIPVTHAPIGMERSSALTADGAIDAASQQSAGSLESDGSRARSKSNESYASLSSSSPDVPGSHKKSSIMPSATVGTRNGEPSSSEHHSIDPTVSIEPQMFQQVSRDPRLARHRSSESKQPAAETLKHQDETVTSSNEATSSKSDVPPQELSTPRQVTSAPTAAESSSDAKVTSTTCSGSKDTITEEQKRLYCPPEPEKLIIFDETLLSRLSKKRNPAPSEATNSGAGISTNDVTFESTASSSKIVNPLLRRKVAPTLTSSQKMVRKPHLTDTVDAILKSDKMPFSKLLLTTENPAPSFDVTTSVSRYEDIVNPVLAVLSGVTRVAKRSRESSGNSVSSTGNMPVLSPISPASTPRSLSGEVEAPPLPPGSPPSTIVPPAPPTDPPHSPADITLSSSSTPFQPVSLPDQAPTSSTLPPDTAAPVEFPRKRMCSKSSYRRRSIEDTDKEDGEISSDYTSTNSPVCKKNRNKKHVPKPKEENKVERARRKPSSEDTKKLKGSSKKKHQEKSKERSKSIDSPARAEKSSPGKSAKVDTKRQKKSSAESKRSPVAVPRAGDGQWASKRRSPSPCDRKSKRRSGSPRDSKSKRRSSNISPSKRDTADCRHSQTPSECSRDSSDNTRKSRDSDRRHSRARKAESRRHVSDEGRRSVLRSRDEKLRSRDEKLPERGSRSNSTSSERIVVRYQERQSPVFTRTVNIANRDSQTETISHKRKSKRRK